MIDASVLPHAEVDSIVELSRNLGTLHVSFWPRRGTAVAPFKIVALEDDALLVAPEGGRPASRIALPCRVPPQEVELVPAGGGYEARLTVALGSPTLERPDLEIRTPLMTDELRSSMPSSYRCSVCDVELVQAASITRYNALPSEHWAELIDAWMCHQDQALSDDLIAKGKGIKPRPDEGLVANTYILFPLNLVRNCDVQAEKQVGSLAPLSRPLPPLSRTNKKDQLPVPTNRLSLVHDPERDGTAAVEGHL